MSTCVAMPLEIEEDGRTWRLYATTYDTADGKFGSYIYTLSDEHAEAICLEMRESVVIAGPVEYVEKWE